MTPALEKYYFRRTADAHTFTEVRRAAVWRRIRGKCARASSESTILKSQARRCGISLLARAPHTFSRKSAPRSCQRHICERRSAHKAPRFVFLERGLDFHGESAPASRMVQISRRVDSLRAAENSSRSRARAQVHRKSCPGLRTAHAFTKGGRLQKVCAVLGPEQGSCHNGVLARGISPAAAGCLSLPRLAWRQWSYSSDEGATLTETLLWLENGARFPTARAHGKR